MWFVTQSSQDIYSLKDALAVAGCLNAFIRCADIVALANLSLLVNVSAPIIARQGGMVRQTIYWPMYLYRRIAGHTALRASVSCPSYRARYTFRGWAIDDEVPYLDVSAALAPGGQTLTLAVVNRHHDAPIEAELRLVGLRAGTTCAVGRLGGQAVAASDRNTLDDPDRVGVTQTTVELSGSRPTYAFAPRSLTLLTLPVA